MDQTDWLMRCEVFDNVLARGVQIEHSGELRSGIFNSDGGIEDLLRGKQQYFLKKPD